MAVTANVLLKERGWRMQTRDNGFCVKGSEVEEFFNDDIYLTEQLKFEKAVFDAFEVPSHMRGYTALSSRMSFNTIKTNLVSNGTLFLEGYYKKESKPADYKVVSFLEAIECDKGDFFVVEKVTEKQGVNLLSNFTMGEIYDGGFRNPKCVDYGLIVDRILDTDIVTFDVSCQIEDEPKLPAKKVSVELDGNDPPDVFIRKYWNFSMDSLSAQDREKLLWQGFDMKPSKHMAGKIAALASQIEEKPALAFCQAFSRVLTDNGMPCTVLGAAAQVVRLKGQFQYNLGRIKFVWNKSRE